MGFAICGLHDKYAVGFYHEGCPNIHRFLPFVFSWSSARFIQRTLTNLRDLFRAGI